MLRADPEQARRTGTLPLAAPLEKKTGPGPLNSRSSDPLPPASVSDITEETVSYSRIIQLLSATPVGPFRLFSIPWPLT